MIHSCFWKGYAHIPVKWLWCPPVVTYTVWESQMLWLWSHLYSATMHIQIWEIWYIWSTQVCKTNQTFMLICHFCWISLWNLESWNCSHVKGNFFWSLNIPLKSRGCHDGALVVTLSLQISSSKPLIQGVDLDDC